MPPAMWVPLLINVLGVYCLFGANLVGRLRLQIIAREHGTAWMRAWLAEDHVGGTSDTGHGSNAGAGDPQAPDDARVTSGVSS